MHPTADASADYDRPDLSADASPDYAPAGPAEPPHDHTPAGPAEPPHDHTPHALLPPDHLPYPVRYEVAYPPRLSRVKTLVRLPLLLPVAVVSNLVADIISAVIVFGWIAVFFRRTYPRWAFTAVSGALAYNARATAYALLQTDKFPSLDATRPDVVLEFAEPAPGSLSRWRVLFWKSILLVPQAFFLSILFFGVTVVTVMAWFAILITGTYPRGLFAFTTGTLRWYHRVNAYLFSFTDAFPPYASSREAGPASSRAVVLSGIAGFSLIGLILTVAANASPPPDQPSARAPLSQHATPFARR